MEIWPQATARQLQPGKRRVSFRFSDPDRGDVVVFKPPAGQPSVCGVERPSDQPCPEGTSERSDTKGARRLTADELVLYSDLVTDALGGRVRLEQERLDWTWVLERLQSL